MSLITLIAESISKISNGATSRQSSGHQSLSQYLIDLPPDARRIIREGRYATILNRQSRITFDPLTVKIAWLYLREAMALVPQGATLLTNDEIVRVPNGFEVRDGQSQRFEVPAFLIDRFCVTNLQYAKFVDAGGYDNLDLWPQSVLPYLHRFTDQTEQVGPAAWIDGKPQTGTLRHPVTGICWFEAHAYATWIGKELPNSEQWQRAGTWSHKEAPNVEPQYPWGNGFDSSKANLWNMASKGPCDVDEYPGGNTVNGVAQLIGNVWEWVDSQYSPSIADRIQFEDFPVHSEVRGGAFDTYFPAHATCHFRTGHPLTRRSENLGFRCCLPASNLVEEPEANYDTPKEMRNDC